MEDIMSREAVVIDPKEMGRKAEKIYADIRGDLEPAYKGKVVAIDVETGDYFLGDTVIAAGQQGREKYPGRPFYFIRVGYPAVHVRR